MIRPKNGRSDRGGGLARRAVIVSPGGLSDIGGVERVMLYAARLFESRGLKVAVVDRPRLRRSAIYASLRPLARGPLGCMVESFAYSAYLASIVRPGDLVVANGFNAFLYPADILFCHGSMRGSRFAVKGRRALWGPEELLEAVAGRFAKRLVAVSTAAAREWIRLYGADPARTRVAPNCVDAAHFVPAGEPRPDGPVRVLFVGRLEPRKGIDRVRRLAESAKAGSLAITVATPSPEGAEIFDGLANVELRVGVPLADLPALYRAADVMYFPSRYEGFEMVSLEALASGLPIVGTRVGGMAELAARGFPGVGTLDDPDDVEATLAAIAAAAAAWRDPLAKRKLHDLTAREYGTEAWTENLKEALDGIL